MTGALALAGFVKASAIVFLGAPRTQAATHAHECGAWMRAPMLVLAVACVAHRTRAALCLAGDCDAPRARGDPAWAAAMAPRRLRRWGSCTSRSRCCGHRRRRRGLWRRASATGLRRECRPGTAGSSAPSPRMQYTSGSFAGTGGALVCAGSCSPSAALRRPRGFVSRLARSICSGSQETVLERIVEPIAGAVMRVSTACAGCNTADCNSTSSMSSRGLPPLGTLVLLEERAMTIALEALLRLLAAGCCVAPLLPGIINKVKAWVAGVAGPPVLQLYYDLARLWRKSVVLSTLASPGFRGGTRRWRWVAIAAAALLLPLGPSAGGVSFRGDVLLLVYLLALARFCTAWAALETGSAFEGMGAAREVSYRRARRGGADHRDARAERAERKCHARRDARAAAGTRGRAAGGGTCSPCCWRRTAACRSTIRTRTSS